MSFAIAIISGLGGIAVSLLYNIPTSGAIALVSVTIFLLTYLNKLFCQIRFLTNISFFPRFCEKALRRKTGWEIQNRFKDQTAHQKSD
jgi:hypothetical protein